YDNGVAFRYDIPEASKLGQFVLTKELTEFRFAGDYRCWAGEEGSCAENQYKERTLSNVPGNPKKPYKSVAPLLVEAPGCYVAIAESDLLDWAGMFLTGTGTSAIGVTLDGRWDRKGLVVSTAPRVSPWRAIMIGRQAGDLLNGDFIATLATPNKIGDASWVKPGVAAWDAWWTGVNPRLPQFKGVDARGDTASDKEYIDLAAEMGWTYQIVDWYWYKNMTSYNKSLSNPPNPNPGDFTQPVPEINVPELIQYAKSKNIRLVIWAHSLDIKTFGVEKALDYLAQQGFAGLKIDFLNSQSQETVQWCEEVLKVAAQKHLVIDFHGTYNPTGLARTYPNFITQEGVLGNEYNKLGGNKCNIQHTITLPFTRALLGPMDFTPGGFLNRTPKDFKVTSPAQVMGTRVRQLAMPVLYPSPMQVMCDSPANYKGQPGFEFYRNLPTAWDESVVLAAEVGKTVAVARRSGEKWYIAAMNGSQETTLELALKFLKSGKWSARIFADKPDGAASDVVESTQTVEAGKSLSATLASGGGFAAVLTRVP
ncbi:TPA: hypothetical protein DDW35_12600, partial [Candidatus Sumerlaeota bacterium]|nr:hypothetical protein [Candidatus Sumerlaeota bacterium]